MEIIIDEAQYIPEELWKKAILPFRTLGMDVIICSTPITEEKGFELRYL